MSDTFGLQGKHVDVAAAMEHGLCGLAMKALNKSFDSFYVKLGLVACVLMLGNHLL